MDLPSPDQQTTMYGLLGFIGTGLMAIARALYKFLDAYIDKIKKEAKQAGVVEAKIDNFALDLKDLKTDIDAIALFVGTPRAIATKKSKEQQNEASSD
ncbi:MAG: hypothetical protein JNL11_10840 [Bdellovibrionaceae bacterium]|nr:hypothetical protein [Pseudobdellovibrionaceae bacterium]